MIIYISSWKWIYIHNNIHHNYDSYLTVIKLTENFIESYRESNIDLEKDFSINYMKCELELYKKELEKT